ncbi:MAG: fatty acid desaturase [Candidatus Accumulibacter sp.]|jgi:fatty acid desaturase|nr:fatty acid desaturase [Accumulibacter sp.]
MTGILNILILILSLSATWLCLWAASHLDTGCALLAAWIFSHVANTPFALMHEAVHGVGHPARRWNELLGVVSGWAFPTSYSMQRAAHQGHHLRNRTDLELYDYYLPGQSKRVRNLWLYLGNLLGLYWWSVVFGNLIYLLAPWAYRSRFFVERLAPDLGFGPYVADLAKLPPSRVWPEIALAFAYQAALIHALDLEAAGLALCYWAFALHWSVLQYADHAWSARDVRNGAWNLKVLAPFRWLALNYHYHLAHHQNPEVPWCDLPKHVDPATPQPSFWRIYLSLWKGVRPAPPMGAPADLGFLFPAADQPGNGKAG